ncbi:MAG: PEP-CTERM sorting domain-containing protein [Deltaproteobacteria bacterium]|nr:PEP-CTERM sorting domain-containing protein [Deltaproteobacteria bacterium]
MKDGNNSRTGQWLLLLLLLSLLPGWAGIAEAVPFPDTTLVLKGSSWDDQPHGWVDVIPTGGLYGISGMDVSFRHSSLMLDLYTSYHGGPEVVAGSLVTHPADLFIDLGLDGTFDYAVALSGHDFNATPVTAGTLYDVGSSVLTTSADYFEGHPVRNYYGEAWDNPWDGTGEAVPVPVAFETGTPLSDTGLSWLATTGPGDPGYHVSLSIALNDLGPGHLGPLGLLWSSAHCANDVMAAQVVPTPEPATMFLVGSGLIGIAALGKKRLSKPSTDGSKIEIQEKGKEVMRHEGSRRMSL